MSESLIIIEKINNLYSGFLSQVIVVMGILVALGGVAIPMYIAWLQRKQLTIDKKELMSDIRVEIENAKDYFQEEIARLHKETEASLRILIENTNEEMRCELSKIENDGRGRAIHLQANANIQLAPARACLDSLVALKCYAMAGNEGNIGAVMSIFKKTILKTYEIDFDTFGIEEQSTKAIEALQVLNENNRYTSDIAVIKEHVGKAKKRVKPVG